MRVSTSVLVLLVLAAGAFTGPAAKSAPLELNYHLRLARPTTHLIEITIGAKGVTEHHLDFILPAWSPGRYAIYNFAKNVQEFEATDARGNLLPWTQPDLETWRVDVREAGAQARVRYRVFANDLNGSFSQFDSSHANLNGPSIFMYLAGHQQDPLTLTVEAPAAWRLISGFSESTAQWRFQAPNYDRLVDTPLEVSRDCSLDEFHERGKLIRVAVHNYPGREASDSPGLTRRLVEGLKRIVGSELAMMPDPDFQHYTFIFHFAPDISEGDGMEHLNSTQIILRGELSQDAVTEALETAAHEFFHLWNVKRLRPAALGPFDYTREIYTPSLWFVEGVTSYYAYVHLLRSGLWKRAAFFEHLAEEIRHLELDEGRQLMSAESSSFHVWFYDRAPQMQETNFANATISYYNKGALLGMILDLEIRSHTRGGKSLDDALRRMYRDFYEAPPASNYGPGRGYTEKDILEAANAVSESDFSAFFDRFVRGTDPLPYAEALAIAGLKLQVAVAPGAAPSLGALTAGVDRGVKILSVRPGGAADRAGLSQDDLLIDVDNLSLATAELKDRLKIYPVGTTVPFTVERHGQRQRVAVTLDPPIADQYSIEELPQASPEQISIRNAWLGGHI